MAPWQCLSHSISCWRNPSFGLTSRLDFTFKYQISFIIINHNHPHHHNHQDHLDKCFPEGDPLLHHVGKHHCCWSESFANIDFTKNPTCWRPDSSWQEHVHRRQEPPWSKPRWWGNAPWSPPWPCPRSQGWATWSQSSQAQEHQVSPRNVHNGVIFIVLYSVWSKESGKISGIICW